MSVRLTDEQIAALIAEPKPLPEDWRLHMRETRKRGSRERQIDITGREGSAFRIVLRQNTYDHLNFTAV